LRAAVELAATRSRIAQVTEGDLKSNNIRSGIARIDVAIDGHTLGQQEQRLARDRRKEIASFHYGPIVHGRGNNEALDTITSRRDERHLSAIDYLAA